MCLWGCFRKRSVFGSVDWVEKIQSHQCGQASSNPPEALIEQKRWRKNQFLLSFISSGTGISELLVLRPLVSDWIIPRAFPLLLLADGRLWDILASVTVWTNSYNKSPRIYSDPIFIINLLSYITIYISYWFCFSGEPWLIQGPLKLRYWEFPGSRPVRTPSFHCWGPGFDPWSGHQDPISHTAKKMDFCISTWLSPTSGFHSTWQPLDVLQISADLNQTYLPPSCVLGNM